MKNEIMKNEIKNDIGFDSMKIFVSEFAFLKQVTGWIVIITYMTDWL